MTPKTNKLANPFRYIAGGRALWWGVPAIAAGSVLLWSSHMVQDSLIHFTFARLPLWQVAAWQSALWLLTALPLWTAGTLLSRSRVRLIDLLGTSALCQWLITALCLPGCLPPVRSALGDAARLFGNLPAAGAEAPATAIAATATEHFQSAAGAWLLFDGVWGLLFLTLYLLYLYRAYALCCNLSGAKAVTSYIATMLAASIASRFLYAWIY